MDATDNLLQVLRVKGRATPETLSAAVLADADGVTTRLADLVAADLVEPTKLGYRVTEVGRQRADDLYEQERSLAGPIVDAVYEAFVALDDQVKQIVTDWQLRPVGGSPTPNDHRDHRYDRQVLARLRRAGTAASTALAPLAGAVARFAVYPQRLSRAVTRVDEGDHSMVAAPIKDSFHTVWFELHEELLILSGRSRPA